MDKKLDLGCGNSKKTGFIGMDQLALPCVDIVHDLAQFPYPFRDSEISEILLDNVLEHLPNPLQTMEEVYRIAKPNAKVMVGVPYFRSFYAVIDPTHRNFFGVHWFYYLDPTHPFFTKYAYSKAKFKIERIEFDREFKKFKIKFIQRIMIKIAEKYPSLYEAKLSHFYPLNSLTFYLTVIKE